MASQGHERPPLDRTLQLQGTPGFYTGPARHPGPPGLSVPERRETRGTPPPVGYHAVPSPPLVSPLLPRARVRRCQSVSACCCAGCAILSTFRGQARPPPQAKASGREGGRVGDPPRRTGQVRFADGCTASVCTCFKGHEQPSTPRLFVPIGRPKNTARGGQCFPAALESAD